MFRWALYKRFNVGMPWAKGDLTSQQYNLLAAMEVVLAEREKEPKKPDDSAYDSALEAARERALKRQAQKAQEAASLKLHPIAKKDEIIKDVEKDLIDSLES